MSGISAITGIAGLTPIAGMGSVSGATAVGGAGSVGGSSAIGGTPTTESSGDSFLNSLSDAFGQLNTQLGAADSSMADFAAGGSADLHTVMLQMEEASISLKAATTVRDKLLEAYQEIMRTQL